MDEKYMKEKKLKLLSLVIAILTFIPGCTKSYMTKDITYKVNEDWNCKKDKTGLFCKIVEKKAVFSMFYIDDVGNYSINDYISDKPTTFPGLDYEFTLNEKVKIGNRVGKNIVYYTKSKKIENDIQIIYNEYIFKYNQRLYIFSYYTEGDVNDDGEKTIYQKYLQDYKDTIKSIKIKR